MKMTVKQRANLYAAIIALVCGIIFIFSPREYHFYPICPFYAATHLLCPGCGGTRALYYLLHFNLAAAWHFNALVTIGAPSALLYFAGWYYSVMRYGQAPAVVPPRWVIASAYVITILFAVVRNMNPIFRI